MPSFHRGWPSPLDVVPKLRACCAVLVLTSDFGREEEMNKEHHGRTNQPQTSWVPLPLGEAGALSPRMMSPDWGRTWETLSPSQHGGGTDNYTEFAKGVGVSFSIKI